MLNKQLLGRATVTNQAGGKAHAFNARHALAQLAVTGCLNDTWYVDARGQLDELLAQCFEVEPRFVAKAAVYARRHGRMKDTPVLLLAWLSAFAGELCEQVFDAVIDNGNQLRSFVQVLRSGLVARRSLGSRPKRLVQQWLERASDRSLIQALVGGDPSLADVIRMVHPRASTVERSALYAWIIGKPVERELLPQALQDLEAFLADPAKPVPEVPFQLLTGRPLDSMHWTAIARNASWTMTRMNLNTFERHGVFRDPKMVRMVANRLADTALIRKARAFPYQLLTAYHAAKGVPQPIRDALREATEIAIDNVPRFKGSVAIAVDVSGSMESPVTGYRNGATTTTRCVDVAGLMAAAVLARHPGAIVLPFNDRIRPWARPRSNSVIDTAQALAQLLGGGTAVSAPLAELNRLGMAPDTVVIVSDNQSWIDHRPGRETETEIQWRRLRHRNPDARLVCVDLQPYTNTQAPDDVGVLNVGGFGDAVFEAIATFSHAVHGRNHWVAAIEATEL